MNQNKDKHSEGSNRRRNYRDDPINNPHESIGKENIIGTFITKERKRGVVIVNTFRI